MPRGIERHQQHGSEVILDEFVAATGSARTYAIRLLNHPVDLKLSIERPRPPHYGPAVKHLLASPEIANRIKHAQAPLPPALIGYSQHRGHRVPVYLPYATLFAHTFLVARSRYGKSTLIQLLIRAAMQEVRDGSLQPGIFCIDPHRDLIEDVLALITLLPS